MSTGAATRLPLLALLTLLALLPPEARGESLAGCALLVALLPWSAGLLRPPAALLGALCLLAAGAWPLAMASSAPGTAVEPLAVLYLALVAGVYSAALPPDDRRRALFPGWLAGVAGIAALHGLTQVLGGLERTARSLEATPLPDRDAVLARLQGGRAFAGFPTPAALGGFLALSIPVTVALAWNGRGKARAALWGLTILQVAGLLATRSVTASAALLAAVGLFLLLRTRRHRSVAAAVAAAVLVLVVVVISRGGEIVGTSRPDHPLRLRAGNARIALEMARDDPWLGVGPGAYGEVYPAYRTAVDNESRHAHDVVLELVAEYGFPLGGFLAVAFFVAFAGPLFRRRRGGEPDWRDGAAVGLAAFAFQSLADFTSFLPSLLWTAAILRGLAFGPDRTPERRPEWVRAPAVFAALAAMVFAALAAGSGAGWNQRVAARQALARGDVAASEAAARRAVRLAPWDPDGRLVLLHATIDRARRDGVPPGPDSDALLHADAAVRLSPVRAAARQVRARLREASGDRAGAWADLALAAALNPMQPDYVRERDRLREILMGAPAQREETP